LSRACLSHRRIGFDPGQSMVSLALGQVSVRVLEFSFVRVIPPAIHTSLHVRFALTGRANGLSLETFQTTMVVRQSENIRYKSAFAFVFETLECKIKDIDTAPSDHRPRPSVKYSIVGEVFPQPIGPVPRLCPLL